jgi:hypothetical protein
VVVTQTLAPSAKLPRFAPDGVEQGQWREKNMQQQRACDASGCIALRHTTWSRLQSPSVRHSYTLYLVDGWSTTSELALRAAHGWSRLTGHQHPPRSISVLYDGAPAPGDELAQIFRTLRATRSAASL